MNKARIGFFFQQKVCDLTIQHSTVTDLIASGIGRSITIWFSCMRR